MNQHNSVNDLTIQEIVPEYYKRNNFSPDGGESDSSVKVVLGGGLFIYLPNNETRKKVILLHDIHHLLTGYSTDLKGEVEISTWELSTGCKSNWMAFILNTYAMALGILFRPGGCWKAWIRGKKTSNLYQGKYSKNQLMNKTLVELKSELGFSNEKTFQRVPVGVFISFSGAIIFSLLFSLASVILIPIVAIYTLFISIRKT